MKHWSQNEIAEQFQEYMDDFSADNYMGTPIDLTVISDVPVTAFIANQDEVCPMDVQEGYLDEINSDVKRHYF